VEATGSGIPAELLKPVAWNSNNRCLNSKKLAVRQLWVPWLVQHWEIGIILLLLSYIDQIYVWKQPEVEIQQMLKPVA